MKNNYHCQISHEPNPTYISLVIKWPFQSGLILVRELSRKYSSYKLNIFNEGNYYFGFLRLPCFFSSSGFFVHIQRYFRVIDEKYFYGLTINYLFSNFNDVMWNQIKNVRSNETKKKKKSCQRPRIDLIKKEGGSNWWYKLINC